MGKSKIEWTDSVWNPVTGCTKVSAGCNNCYAETNAMRFWGSRKFSDVQLHHDRLVQPLRWKKPRRIFVCSMGDLFHPEVDFEFIYRVFETMNKADQHIFILLTKRPKRMKEYFDYFFDVVGIYNISQSNLWLGVSVEDQKTADERISILLSIPSKVHFVSCEPLLGRINLELNGHNYGRGYDTWSERLDWVIAGCESGPKRRECSPDWIYDIIGQCSRAEVPCFIKQMSWFNKVIKPKDYGKYFIGDLPMEYPG
jgi:protein gp37